MWITDFQIYIYQSIYLKLYVRVFYRLRMFPWGPVCQHALFQEFYSALMNVFLSSNPDFSFGCSMAFSLQSTAPITFEKLYLPSNLIETDSALPFWISSSFIERRVSITLWPVVCMINNSTFWFIKTVSFLQQYTWQIQHYSKVTSLNIFYVIFLISCTYLFEISVFQVV